MATGDFDLLYRELLLDHSRQRHGHGLREGFSAEAGRSNRSCGDEIVLRVHLAGSVLESLSWEGAGCAISQASASMLSDLVHGLGPGQALERISALRGMLRSRGADEGSPELLGDAVALSGVSRYPRRIDCAMLAWVALEEAIGALPSGESTGTGSAGTGQEE